jgi:large subunit ribosomal protein L3
MSVGFAKKIGMTRIFKEGKSVAVTAIQFSPSFVLQQKTEETDGYTSIQVGSVKKRKVSKAMTGHIKKALDVDHGFRLITEFKNVINLESEKKEFTVEDFNTDDVLDITGTTIGRGTTGAVKRWGFAGQPQTHGHDHVRAVGSMGGRWPQRVPKGKKMAGHYGAEGLTLKKVKVLAVDKENGLLFVNGSVPGANSSFLKIQKVA